MTDLGDPRRLHVLRTWRIDLADGTTRLLQANRFVRSGGGGLFGESDGPARYTGWTGSTMVYSALADDIRGFELVEGEPS